MLGLMLVAFMSISAMISATIGKGRFYLQRTKSGREFRRAYYGEWVEKLFAGISTVGFLPMALIELGRGIAWLMQDDTEEPYIFSIFLTTFLALCYYQLLLTIAHRCENDYRYRKIQAFTIGYRLASGKMVADMADLMASFERVRKTMSRHVVFDPDAELDIIDPAIPAEMKRSKRIHLSGGHLEIEKSRNHRGWGVVRCVRHRHCMTTGNLALESEKPVPEEASPQADVAMPIVNLKPTPEELLSLQLAALPKEDCELIEQLFLEEPAIRYFALAPNYSVRLSIIPESETVPRHVRICGIVHKRAR